MDNGMTGDNGNAIAFESYLGKSAQSRATVVTTESLKKEGFTVIPITPERLISVRKQPAVSL